MKRSKLESAANIISMVSGGNMPTIFIIIWLSGIASDSWIIYHFRHDTGDKVFASVQV
ncbi:MAG: hypothetical protein ACLU7V_07740 [Anaerovoracaceae bacterium]